MGHIKCPIWGTDAELLENPQRKDGCYINSPRAGGRYFVTNTVAPLLEQWPGDREHDQWRAKLTTWLVDQRRLGAECPKIDKPCLEHARQQRCLGVLERANRLLEYIADAGAPIGDVGAVPVFDDAAYAWMEAERADATKEISFLEQYLIKKEYISSDRKGCATVSVDGYLYLDSIRNKNQESKPLLPCGSIRR